jgi:hypothetical protein
MCIINLTKESCIFVYPTTSLGRPFGLQEFGAPRTFRKSTNESDKVVNYMAWKSLFP